MNQNEKVVKQNTIFGIRSPAAFKINHCENNEKNGDKDGWTEYFHKKYVLLIWNFTIKLIVFYI